MDWLIANYQTVFQIVGYVFSAATLVAMLTPTETDNKIIDTLADLANRFGYTFKPGALVKN